MWAAREGSGAVGELGCWEKLVRFVVADDHPLYLEAICGQISRAFEGAEVCSFTGLEEALAALAERPADLLMLDFSMPGMDGPEGVKKAVDAAGGAPVAVLSGVADAKDVADCIAAGARGFFTKTMDARVLTNAISVVLYGGTFVPTEFMGDVGVTAGREEGRSADTGAGEPDFSERELVMLRMISEGASNKEIARQLDLQEVTVKFYLSRLFSRLGVKNRAQAAVEALRLNLLEDAGHHS
jgi:DNA-binding NarL/FixJ family response regulator